MTQPASSRPWVFAVIGAAAFGLGFAWLIAQSPRGMSQYDRLAAEIGCQCGTCPLRPIATCGCGFADGMLGELAGLVDEGHEDHEIMATFVMRYNESIRIKPASSGLELTAWAAPILLLTVGAVALAGVLVRWTRENAPAAVLPATPQHDDDAEPAAEDARLRALVDRELEELGD